MGVREPRGLDKSSWGDKGYQRTLPSTFALAISMRTLDRKKQKAITSKMKKKACFENTRAKDEFRTYLSKKVTLPRLVVIPYG